MLLPLSFYKGYAQQAELLASWHFAKSSIALYDIRARYKHTKQA